MVLTRSAITCRPASEIGIKYITNLKIFLAGSLELPIALYRQSVATRRYLKTF